MSNEAENMLDMAHNYRFEAATSIDIHREQITILRSVVTVLRLLVAPRNERQSHRCETP